MQIRFDNGTPRLSYQVQASSDLHAWTTVASMVADPFGSFTYVDPQSANQSSRFYRASTPLPTNCPAPQTASTAPVDPAIQAMLDQISILWQPELDRLNAAAHESDFIGLIPSLRLTPLEISISALLAGPQADLLRQLMLSINRVPFSSGAAAHVKTLVTSPTGIDTAAAFKALHSAISQSTDPDGVQRSFLVDLMVSLPGVQSRLKSYAASHLLNDTAGTSTTLSSDGKRLFRTELFRAYMFSNPDLTSDLLPFANQILSALSNPQDKAPILREMTIRHPALLVDYLASKPAVAVGRPGQN